VAFAAARARGVERGAVAEPRFVAQHGEWKNLLVAPQRFQRVVGAAIVERDDLVLARVRLEHGSDAPEKQPDRGCFIECGNADVQHVDE
jgi:hypothetical protein